MHGRDVLYIVEERARRRPALVTDVGVRLPSHLTATGRAMLAALPREQVRALFPDIRPFIFGHFGDGNLHYNLSRPAGADRDWVAVHGEAITDAVLDEETMTSITQWLVARAA